MDNIKFFILLISLGLVPSFLSAQMAPNQPEQDCIHAISVCQDIFVQPNAYQGAGKNSSEINPRNSCLLSGEQNDVWYIFTVQQSGDLCFSIIPNDSTDDYDWALFDLTQADCSDIFHQTGIEVACNYHTAMPTCGGITGANGLLQSACAPLNEPCIQVQQGQTFVLNVSNFSASASGYTLDFSTSTADIYDQQPPSITDFENVCSKDWKLQFNERVKVSSVQATDFLLRDSLGNDIRLASISPIDTANSYCKGFTFRLDSLLAGGNYELVIVDTVLDKCEQMALWNQPFSLSIQTRYLHIESLDAFYCRGDSLLLSAQSTGDILWQGLGNQPRLPFIADESRWLHASATFSNGCLIQDSVYVNVRKPRLPALAFEENYCQHDSLYLPKIDVDSVANLYWKIDNETLSARNAHAYSLSSTGLITFELVGEMNLCPVESDSFFIRVHSRPKVDFSMIGKPCLDENQIELVSSNSEAVSFQWKIDGNNLNTNSAGVLHPFTEVGKHEVSLSISNEWGCQNSLEKVIEIFPNPKLKALEKEFCEGEEIYIHLNELTDDAPLRWNWQMGPVQHRDSVFSILRKEPGDHQFGFEVENAHGCRRDSTYRVRVNPRPQASLLKADFCEREPFSIELEQGATSASWNLEGLGLGEGLEVDVPGLDAGNYSLKIAIRDSLGCSNQLERQINVHPTPHFELNYADSLCAGQDLEITILAPANARYAYQWDTAPERSHDDKWIRKNVEKSLEFEVYASDEWGCSSLPTKGRVGVLSPEIVSLNLSATQLKLPNARLLGRASSEWPGLNYVWDDGAGNQYRGATISVDYLREGIFPLTLLAKTRQGCEVEVLRKEIRVERGALPKAASAFSPNGDGINDTWDFYGPLLGNTQVMIFNRWGKEVFEGNGSVIRWDGKSKSGQDCAPGIYVYKLLISNSQGKRLEVGGSLTLIK